MEGMVGVTRPPLSETDYLLRVVEQQMYTSAMVGHKRKGATKACMLYLV